MSVHKVIQYANEGVFIGLSKQNLLFHQCVEELCDNAIAAKKDDKKAMIDICFVQSDDSEYIDLYVCDQGKGMKTRFYSNF